VNAPEHIERNQPDPDGLDFDALRKSGLAFASRDSLAFSIVLPPRAIEDRVG